VRFAAALALCVAAGAIAPVGAAGDAQTPIRHFVVLMQENHSFDNYFGTYSGANGIPGKTCMPVDPRAEGGGRCVRPFRLGGRAVPDLGHDRRMHELQYAGGRLNGFVRAASIDRQRVERSVMGHYDGRDLPFYWEVAKQYVLFDRFFASAAGGSVPNHMFWVTGRPGLPGLAGRVPREGFGELRTIFDRLQAAGISWKFYVEDYDPRRSVEARGTADLGVQAVRVPLLNFSRYVYDRKLFGHIVDLEEYYEDLRSGELPEVAYIAPSRSSEHPPGRVEAGADLVRRLLTALAMSDAWKSAAFFWTYDDWGGWFDHVRPPPGYGFRVPALLVSPYARRGHIDSTRLETTSILRFIEDNWKLKPLGGRDARAHSFAEAFDFSRPPRAPRILTEGAPARQREPRRSVIYIGYGAALLLGGALFGWVLLSPGSRSRAHLPCQLLAVALALSALGAPAAAAQSIQTVPKVPGMRFSLEGRVFEAGRDGRAHPPPALGSSRAALRAHDTKIAPGIRASFDRWYRGRRIAAIKLYYRVRPTFVDLSGRRVDPRVVTSVVVRGSQGRRYVFEGDRPQWLQGNRVVPESHGTRSAALYYSAEKALVAGSSVVHRGQQRFFPAKSSAMELRLLLFAARVTVRDALLGFPIGSAVRLEYPNGRMRRHALGPGAGLTLRSLPRGDYRVSVDALGISSSQPIALSRDQQVDLKVISWLDVAVVLLALASVALALLFLRRPGPVLGRRRKHAAGVTATLVVALTFLAAAPAGARAESPADPLFAYYYIWFNADSWNRAKIDYPLLGRYSSDERDVMRRHVHWAKQAGIDGFIVSWKSTPVLNRRLKRLAEVSEAARFKLLVIYQGLDFERKPLAASRVSRDLGVFWSRFAKGEAFDVFPKPVVIWSGTPKFTREQVASATRPWNDRLLVLASERNVDGYRRVADLVAGNAYYWGSVNPATYPRYPEKLAEMGKAIHERGGLWIAPAAPGFDARLVGGTSVVPRRDGATLRTQLDAATASAPDAVGLISWNEFSENTHIEPSRAHGSRYLEVVADVRGAELPELRDFDSSQPAATGVSYGVPLLGGFALLLGTSFLMLLRHARRRPVA
jgi:phospholipase C